MSEAMDFWLRLWAGLPYQWQLAKTVLVLGGFYLAYLVLRLAIARLVDEPVARFGYTSLVRYGLGLLGAALVGAVWLEELKTVALLLTGLIAASLIAAKELYLGLLGRIALFAAEHYRLGDRVFVNGVGGDVIGIGLLFTWLAEVGGQEPERQSTGRVVLIPHMWLLLYPVANATTSHDFVWDELDFVFPVTVRPDRVIPLLEAQAARLLAGEVQAAERGVRRLARRFAYRRPPVTPIAYAAPLIAPDGRTRLRITMRYVSRARERRRVRSLLLTEALAALRREGIDLVG